ncbi:unnamed protein product [Lampetra planeri]
MWRKPLGRLGAEISVGIEARGQLPTGAIAGSTAWTTLNRLGTQVGGSRSNLVTWRCATNPASCCPGCCSERRAACHLLFAHCSRKAPALCAISQWANCDVLGCTRHWKDF